MTAVEGQEPRSWWSNWLARAKDKATTSAQKAKEAARNGAMHVRDGWDRGWQTGKKQAERGWRFTTDKSKQAAAYSRQAIGKGIQKAINITNLQKMAGLEPRLMQRSAESVIDRPTRRQVDRDWQRGYSVIAAERVPGTVIWPRAERDADLDPEAGG